jgi:endonuclease/exonuclease/phosphatase family metal-dependent hydrolase
VALQEVLHHDSEASDQAQQIADGSGYWTAFAPAWHIGGGLQFGNAVLSRFPIVSSQAWTLPGEPERETRCLLHVLVDAPCGRVPIFNTHLDWELHRGFVRERQVAFIAERVNEVAPVKESFPPLLMGDFNAEPASDEIRWLRGYTSRLGRSVYFCDAWDAAGDGSAGYTFTRRNPFSAQAGEPDRRLDYVFVRGPDRALRGQPLVARVVCDASEAGVFASDHFGVYVEVRAS